jgi:hypothetical protein
VFGQAIVKTLRFGTHQAVQQQFLPYAVQEREQDQAGMKSQTLQNSDITLYQEKYIQHCSSRLLFLFGLV